MSVTAPGALFHWPLIVLICVPRRVGRLQADKAASATSKCRSWRSDLGRQLARKQLRPPWALAARTPIYAEAHPRGEPAFGTPTPCRLDSATGARRRPLGSCLS